MGMTTWPEFEAFIRGEMGLDERTPLSQATRLVDDLGQTGDDANELLDRFFRQFAVVPGDFDFHRYFLMEGGGLLYSMFRRVILRRPHTLRRQPITLGMLYLAALDKRWDTRKIESAR